MAVVWLLGCPEVAVGNRPKCPKIEAESFF